MLDDKTKEMNLKPFDIEAARAGASVVTRTGKPARVICFDSKQHGPVELDSSMFPVIALVPDPVLGEYPQSYTDSGAFSLVGPHELDLFMLPVKRSGWVNIYPSCLPPARLSTVRETSFRIYVTKAAADANADPDAHRVACVFIEWEE